MNYALNQEIAKELGWFIASSTATDLLSVCTPDGIIIMSKSIRQFEDDPDTFNVAFPFYTGEQSVDYVIGELLNLPAPVPHANKELAWSLKHYTERQADALSVKVYEAKVGHINGFGSYESDNPAEALAGAWLMCWREIKAYWKEG